MAQHRCAIIEYQNDGFARVNFDKIQDVTNCITVDGCNTSKFHCIKVQSAVP